VQDRSANNLVFSFVTIVHGQQEPRTPPVPEDKAAATTYIYEGPASSKRVSSSAPVFIMRLENGANPTSLIALYPAEKKKKERQVGRLKSHRNWN
jgi:hypothetical protein